MKKRHYNETTREWYTEGNSLTRRVNGTLFSGVPSEEQLTQWGFVEWVEPEPTPEQVLESAKQEKIAELEDYDRSNDVNSFLVNGQPAWIDAATRSNYRGSLSDCELMGVTDIQLPIAGSLLPMTVADAKVYLARVQLYADRCTIVTKMHEAAIRQLQTVEQVAAYDFTAGYPPKEEFTIS